MQSDIIMPEKTYKWAAIQFRFIKKDIKIKKYDLYISLYDYYIIFHFIFNTSNVRIPLIP